MHCTLASFLLAQRRAVGVSADDGCTRVPESHSLRPWLDHSLRPLGRTLGLLWFLPSAALFNTGQIRLEALFIGPALSLLTLATVVAAMADAKTLHRGLMLAAPVLLALQHPLLVAALATAVAGRACFQLRAELSFAWATLLPHYPGNLCIRPGC
ncbi:hypothetical protein IV102_33515 [bacterium]|nr:hypothetical protein [bacterium]